jgi:hypothetical protein
MATITLTAKNPTEQRVLDYLKENASEVLAERINAGKKTIAGALNYAKEEAHKTADGESCVCVDDATVFGWIVHFFEEDHIKEKAKASRGPILPGRKLDDDDEATITPKPAMTVNEEIAALKKRLLTLKPVKVKRSRKPEPTQSMFEALLEVKA